MDKKDLVALYVRVSTEEQAEEGYSIEAQLVNLREYCKTNGYEVINEYVDEGISGKDFKNRPALLSLLKDSEKGLFNLILVWKLSRLSRRQVHQLNIAEQLFKNGVSLKSVTEPFDYGTSSGKFNFAVLGAVAELERNTISENVTLAMKQKAKKGEWNGGRIIGYDLVDGRLIINREESQIVKKIFDLYCQGNGLKYIANKLNHEGYRTKTNRPFSTGAIKTIVENPTYIGKIRWSQHQSWNDLRRKGKTEPIIADGLHLPIISIDKWQLARSLAKQRTNKASRQYTGKFPLAGFLRCPECGSAMVGTNHSRRLKSGIKHYRQYVCGKFHRCGSAVCTSNMVKAEIIEQQVLGRLTEAVQHPEIIREVIRKVNSQNKNQTTPLLNELHLVENKLKQLELNQEKAIQLSFDGIIDDEVLKKQLKNVDVQMKHLSLRHNEISLQLTDKTEFEIQEIEIINSIKDLAKVFAESEVEMQKRFLMTMVKDITLIGRQLDKVNLQFNIHRKNPKSDKSNPHHETELSGGELPLNFSHSFMIRFTLSL